MINNWFMTNECQNKKYNIWSFGIKSYIALIVVKLYKFNYVGYIFNYIIYNTILQSLN